MTLAKKIQKTSIQNPVNDKTVRALADSIFEHLKEEGCDPKDIISVSSQLLGLVTHDIQSSDNDDSSRQQLS